MRFIYETATRKMGAALLEWKGVDRAAGITRFPREIEKNGKPREIPLVGVIGDVIERRWAARTYQTKLGPALARYVFHRGDGQVIVNPRRAWANATAAAGVPGLLLHDLRRSTVKNLIAAGVDQVTAMKVTGHRSLQVFQRYNIVHHRRRAPRPGADAGRDRCTPEQGDTHPLGSGVQKGSK